MGVFQQAKLRDAQSTMAKCDLDVACGVFARLIAIMGRCLDCSRASRDGVWGSRPATPSRPEEPASLPEHPEPTIRPCVVLKMELHVVCQEPLRPRHQAPSGEMRFGLGWQITVPDLRQPSPRPGSLSF